MLSELWIRARAIFRRKAVEQDLADELRFHVEQQVAKYAAAGMTREEAARRARLEFGGLDQTKEQCRDARGIRFVESLAQDVRFALRTLRRSPGFTAVAVITLALGIGANTAIFSATYGILLKPLAYPQPDRLVSMSVWMSVPAGGHADPSIAGVDDLASAGIFDGIAGSSGGDLRLSGSGAPAILDTESVTGNYFSLFGVRPLLGEPITAANCQPGRDKVVVLSYKFWQSQFGGRKDLIGKQIALADAFGTGTLPSDYAVIGIMPASFRSPGYSEPDAWTPLVPTASGQVWHGVGGAFIAARLKPGMTVARANAALGAFSDILAKRYPELKGTRYQAQSLRDMKVDNVRLALLALLGAAGFVLLIACVNVSNLALARGWGRMRETAIRKALGASRWRVIRQFLTESVLLSAAGGAIGLLIGVWGVRVLRALAPPNTPRLDELHFSATVFWYTLGIALLAGIFFGLAPAIQISGKRLDAAMKGSGLTSLALPQARSSAALRNGLIVSEVALAVTLLVGCGLVLRSFDKLTSVPLGLRTHHVLTTQFNLSRAGCQSEASCDAIFAQMLQRVGALPGIESASIANLPPLAGTMLSQFAMPGNSQSQKLGQTDNRAELVQAGPDYFRTVCIPLLHGRDFSPEDGKSAPPVAIVNRSFARRYLGGHALGSRIATNWDRKGATWREVVGEVADSRDADPSLKPRPEFYLPFAQSNAFPAATLLVRTAGDPVALAPAIRERVWSLDKEAVFSYQRTVDQILAQKTAAPRFHALLLGSFGALGLLLALVGIYGVISYSVSRQTHEIGIRMALGARPGAILSAVIGRGLLLSGAGIALGIAGALALTRFLRSLLFEITPTDPATFIGVAVLFLLVALAACYLPARRAMRVDPMVALRHE